MATTTVESPARTLVESKNVLTETPFFVILKSGQCLPAGEVTILQSPPVITCRDCNRPPDKGEDDFVNGVCNFCTLENFQEQGDCDHVEMSGSTTFKEAFWYETNPTAHEGEILLQFANGGLAKYVKVPKDIWLNLLQAKSPGKFYNEHLKGQYENVHKKAS